MQIRRQRWQEVAGVVRMVGIIGLAVVLGYLIPRINAAKLPSLLSYIGADQVIAFLSSMATGMMAFTGLVFSLLFVLIQFGSTEFTPRIVDILGRDESLYNAGGIFTGTFLYGLMALRGVGTFTGNRTGSLILGVAFLWLLASVIMVVRLVHTSRSLTHTKVLYLLSDTGHREIDRAYPQPAGEAAPAATPPASDAPTRVVPYTGNLRYVHSLNVGELVALARKAESVIYLPFALGDALVARTPLALVRGSSDMSEKQLLSAIELARDRAMDHNPKYSLRLLVDIAIRALSPAVNDPTTAAQVLDHIEGLLVSLGNAKLDVGRIADLSGRLRLVYQTTRWEEYLDMGLAEIRHYGEHSSQVERRLAALLAFLHDHVPPERQAAVERFAEQREHPSLVHTFSSPGLH
jgi:uncharacterized membrane protein